MSVDFYLVQISKNFENLWTITVNCKNVCKIITQTKLTNVLYRFLLYFPKFQEDILKNEKFILHEFLQELVT